MNLPAFTKKDWNFVPALDDEKGFCFLYELARTKAFLSADHSVRSDRSAKKFGELATSGAANCSDNLESLQFCPDYNCWPEWPDAAFLSVAVDERKHRLRMLPKIALAGLNALQILTRS